jgi:hypothetical protein
MKLTSSVRRILIDLGELRKSLFDGVHRIAETLIQLRVLYAAKGSEDDVC